MGLLDEVREATTSPGLRCRVDVIKEELGKEGDDLQVLIDEGRSLAAIAAALRKRSLRVGEHALRNHRKRTCVCYR